MTTTPTPTPGAEHAPTLNGQVIGQAERSTRAVLERLLAETGTPFQQWVTINLVGNQAGNLVGNQAEPESHSERRLVDHLTSGLLIGRAAAQAAVDAARSDGLIGGIDHVALTPEGQARFDAISAGIADITARLYSDLAYDDLVVARRVLEALTERARAALAA